MPKVVVTLRPADLANRGQPNRGLCEMAMGETAMREMGLV